MKNSNFFSTGELAKLAGISKQLLIFYDRQRIFSSDETESNGYRHYSLSSFFRLKILITLRKLGLSLDDIAHYFTSCNDRTLTSIYKGKISEYDKQIKELQRKRSILEKQILQMQRTPCGQVLIREQHDSISYCRWEISMQDPIKKRIVDIAHALHPYLKDPACLEDSIQGFILPVCSLMTGQYPSSYSFLTLPFSDSEAAQDLPPHSPFFLKSGVYLVIQGNSRYGILSKETRDKLVQFMHRNDMIPDRHFFIFPNYNYWMMSQREGAATVMVRVTYLP